MSPPPPKSSKGKLIYELTTRSSALRCGVASVRHRSRRGSRNVSWESPGGRYANNQLLALSLSLTSISRTVIIFDWDDTICPSTFVDQFKVDTFSDLPPHVSFPHRISSHVGSNRHFSSKIVVYMKIFVSVYFSMFASLAATL